MKKQLLFLVLTLGTHISAGALKYFSAGKMQEEDSLADTIMRNITATPLISVNRKNGMVSFSGENGKIFSSEVQIIVFNTHKKFFEELIINGWGQKIGRSLSYFDLRNLLIALFDYLHLTEKFKKNFPTENAFVLETFTNALILLQEKMFKEIHLSELIETEEELISNESMLMRFILQSINNIDFIDEAADRLGSTD